MIGKQKNQIWVLFYVNVVDTICLTLARSDGPGLEDDGDYCRGGLLMCQSKRLRIEAERCFRLARGAVDARLARELEVIGQTFAREAEELDALVTDVEDVALLS